MKNTCLFLALSLLISSYDTRVVDTPQEGEQNHLVPVNPYRDEKQTNYLNLLRACLDIPDPVDNPTLLLFMPAFDPEECVEVRARGMDSEIIYTTVDRNVWYSMPENNNDGVAFKPKMRRLVSPLPKKVATRIDALWSRLLQDVRYDKINEFPGAIVDGVVIEFWYAGRYGKTDDPDSGLPMLMTELGKELIKLCKSDMKTREEIINSIEKKVLDIEKYKRNG